MNRWSQAFLLALISISNLAFSDDTVSQPNKSQTNNILDQTKQKLDNAAQVGKDKLEKGIQQGEGQPDKSN